MAPEQYGDAGKADGKADVFALGVMLYENPASVEKARKSFPVWR
jgi:hypothetical protein